MQNKQTGIKLDDGKLPLADFLLDFKEEILDLCKIYKFGCDKYGRGNFKFVEDGQERFNNALLRHFFEDGYNDETNCKHKAHVVYNALMVLWFENNLKKE